GKALRYQGGAVERLERDVAGFTASVTDGLAEPERRGHRFRADHDSALEVHTGQCLAHGVGCGPADSLPIEVSHPAPGREGGGLGGAQQLEAKIRLDRSRRGDTARGWR